MVGSKSEQDTYTLIELSEVDSTNSEAMRRATAGERGPLWIRADVQTAGRGRSGRSWTSTRGNLAFSLLFQPGGEPRDLPQLSLLAGVAVHEAIAEHWPAGAADGLLRLKWPNDLLIDRAKIAGLLVEASVIGDARIAVVGIGVNLAFAPDIPGREVTCLADHMGTALAPSVLAESIARRFHVWHRRWLAPGGFEPVREAWLRSCGPLGEPIVINAAEGPVSGAFLGLDTDGALLLGDAAGARRRFTFGDVTLGTGPKA